MWKQESKEIAPRSTIFLPKERFAVQTKIGVFAGFSTTT
jgi:hypothetical protein